MNNYSFRWIYIKYKVFRKTCNPWTVGNLFQHRKYSWKHIHPLRKNKWCRYSFGSYFYGNITFVDQNRFDFFLIRNHFLVFDFLWWSFGSLVIFSHYPVYFLVSVDDLFVSRDFFLQFLAEIIVDFGNPFDQSVPFFVVPRSEPLIEEFDLIVIENIFN